MRLILSLPVIILLFVLMYFLHIQTLMESSNSKPIESNSVVNSIQESTPAPKSKDDLPSSDIVANDGESKISLSQVQFTSSALTKNKMVNDIEDQKKIGVANSFNQWIIKSSNENSSFNLANEMHKRFEKEPVDTFWALDQESAIRDMFNNNTELSGSALKEVVCHTTQCQLLIAINDRNHANKLVETMGAILTHKNSDFIIISSSDEEVGVTALFLVKASSVSELNFLIELNL